MPKHTTQPMPIMKHPETAQETAQRQGSPNNWCVSATLSCLRTRSNKHVQERSPTHVNVRATYIPTPISFPRHGMGTDLIRRGGLVCHNPCHALPSLGQLRPMSGHPRDHVKHKRRQERQCLPPTSTKQHPWHAQARCLAAQAPSLLLLPSSAAHPP